MADVVTGTSQHLTAASSFVRSVQPQMQRDGHEMCLTPSSAQGGAGVNSNLHDFYIKAGKKIVVSFTTEIVIFSVYIPYLQNTMIPCLLDSKGNVTVGKVTFKVTQAYVFKD